MPAVSLHNQVVVATSVMQGAFSNSQDYSVGQVVQEGGQFYRIGHTASATQGNWSVTGYDSTQAYSDDETSFVMVMSSTKIYQVAT